MLTVGIVGIGNAGSQVVALAAKENIEGVVINTSENDLSTISEDILKFPLGDLKGAGKNRKEAKVFFKDSAKKILGEEKFMKFFTDKDVVFIVSSTGGGTGSGISPVLTQIIKKSFPDTNIILVGILPTLEEAYSTQVNTLEYIKELYDKLDKPTYMLYDNDRFKKMKTLPMMEGINKAIVNDINILMGKHNHTTKYSSIDEKDMSMIISTTGRIVVSSYTDIKEKDLDNASIDEVLVKNLKNSAHSEIQLDKKVKRFGIIANLSESMTQKFDDNIPAVQEVIGSPVEEFRHISINTDKSLPNNVFLIAAGLSPIVDRIEKINERIQEIESLEKEEDDMESALSAIDINAANGKREYKTNGPVEPVNVVGILDDFM